MSTHKIPTLAELHKGNPDAFDNDQVKTLLNVAPPQSWIKKHPMTNGPYLPVDKVDYLLDSIYGRWELHINSISQIENSVVAIVTLKVWNPARNEWDYQDGGGAAPIQTDKESRASDMTAIKANGVQLAVPAAISYAKKDAADNYGKIFGRDLTRKDTLTFNPSFKEDPYIPESSSEGEQPPPPPPPLPAEIAAKVVAIDPEKTMLQVAPVQPAAFTANAFANPDVAAPAVQFPDLNTTINF